METIDVYNVKGEKISNRDLKDEIFNVSVREDILHQVVRGQLASARAGTASSKNRSKVQSSSKKLWRQKGSGRARVGAASSPVRKGGGVVFGPTPRDYSFKINKKIKKMALRMALTDKFKAGRMLVIDEFNLGEIKTKKFVDILRSFNVDNALIVTEKPDENLEKSSGNVRKVKLLRAEGLNVYDVLTHKCLLFVEPALGIIEEALG
jgi:large subunit ribosomal protein L4